MQIDRCRGRRRLQRTMCRSSTGRRVHGWQAAAVPAVADPHAPPTAAQQRSHISQQQAATEAWCVRRQLQLARNSKRPCPLHRTAGLFDCALAMVVKSS